MAQQTAIDWIVDQMLSEGHKEMWKDMIQQAKQMEKKQMKKSWSDGFSFQSPYKNFEQYYKETYSK